MAAADMTAWRRQNSNSIAVEVILVDGSTLKGAVIVSRDKTMREYFNVPGENFFDFDCRRDGPLVIAKSSVRCIRETAARANDDQTKIEALAVRRAELEKSDPYNFFGVTASADNDSLHKAYIAKARVYHPDRFLDANLPPEVMDYLNAMARRVNNLYDQATDARDGATAK